MSRLLLFTNEYPYATGDVVFVRNEIEALAERFDDVVVFCRARDTSQGMVSMPANVTFGGNLFESAPEDRQRPMWRWRSLRDLAEAAWRELRAGRLRGHTRLFLGGCLAGVTWANRRIVRDAIIDPAQTVAYAFWGMGSGQVLPWLEGVAGRAVRLHRYDLYEESYPTGYLPHRAFLFARANLVLAISRDGIEYLERTYRNRKLDEKVVLSRLGVPGPERLTRPPRARERLVVSCSAISDVKRVHLILEALQALPGLSEDAPVRWVHFGTGEHYDELLSSAKRDVPGLTTELRGQTPNEDITRFYADNRVDVFVNASRSEGVPVSIMEAIAHDIPVVATAVGGTPEIVGPELGTGELVPADVDAERLAGTIRAVLDAPDEAYSPRTVWESEFDSKVAGALAAAHVHALLERKTR